jgi:phosphate transport system permease protein
VSWQPRTARAQVAMSGARGVTKEVLSDQPRKDVVRNTIFASVLFLTIAVALAGLGLLIGDAIVDGWSRLNLDLLTQGTSSIPEDAGLRSAIIGTVWIIGFVILFIVPLGVGAAVYLEEYANKESKLSRLVEVNIQNLAAVPSIIYGLLGLAVFVSVLGLSKSLLAGGLTLALLVLPIIIIASREAIRAVPISIEQGAMALGATRWQAVSRQVFPAALPGMLTGTILAMSRAVGEAAPLIVVGGVVFGTQLPSINPLESNDTPLFAMPLQIFFWAGDPRAEFQDLAASGIIVLLGFLIIMNTVAIVLRNRYSRRW